MVWQQAALPMSLYIFLKSTTRSMPATSNAVVAAWGAVILSFSEVVTLHTYQFVVKSVWCYTRWCVVWSIVGRTPIPRGSAKNFYQLLLLWRLHR